MGYYNCKCPLGMHGDGKLGNCQGFRVTTIASGTNISITFQGVNYAVIYNIYISKNIYLEVLCNCNKNNTDIGFEKKRKNIY